MSPGAEELHLINQTANATPAKETQFIWVLSARHTITKEHNNCPVQSINYVANADISVNETKTCDEEDDFQRMKYGLEIAQQIVAKRARKSIEELVGSDYEQHAPSIIYNGSPVQNKALHQVIHEGLKSKGLPYYPASKFIIFELAPKEIHTGGQLNALAILKESDERLSALNQPVANVTIVSSAYHIPRVRRLFDSKKFKNPFRSDAILTFAGIDRAYQRPCAQDDCKGEKDRIKNYTQSGDIGKPTKSNWYDLSSLKNWTPLRQAREEKQRSHALIAPSETINALDLAKITIKR